MNTLRMVSAAIGLAVCFAALAQNEDESPVQVPTFEQVDADHNGYITPAEAEKVEGLSGMFAVIDTDSDGQISAEEYGVQSESH